MNSVLRNNQRGRWTWFTFESGFGKAIHKITPRLARSIFELRFGGRFEVRFGLEAKYFDLIQGAIKSL